MGTLFMFLIWVKCKDHWAHSRPVVVQGHMWLIGQKYFNFISFPSWVTRQSEVSSFENLAEAEEQSVKILTKN